MLLLLDFLKQAGIKQPDKGNQHWINYRLLNTMSHQ